MIRVSADGFSVPIFALALASFLPSQAQAVCDANVVNANNQIITCDANGVDNVGISNDGVSDTTTVNILDGASITLNNNAVGVDLLANSKLNMFGSASIYTNGSQGANFIGDNATITLNDNSSIRAVNATNINLSGDNNTVLLNNNSSILSDFRNILIVGNNNSITLNDTSFIQSTGNYGVELVNSNNNTINLNDASSIQSADNGINLGGNSTNNTINLNDSSSIQSTTGIQVSGNSNDNTVTLNDNAFIDALGVGVVFNSNNNSLTVGAGTSILSQTSVAVLFGLGSNSLTNFGTITTQSGAFPAILGANNAGFIDTIINFGAIVSQGTAIDLKDGNDLLTLGTGSSITGTIDGGDDLDTVTFNGSGSEDDDFVNFEGALMDGVNWSLSGNSTFDVGIVIINGRLAIDGNIAAVNTLISPNGVLGGISQLTGTVVSTGTIAPGNGVGTLTIDGDVTQDGQLGGTFDIEFDQNALDLLTITGQLTLLNTPGVNVTALNGASGANGVIIHADNGIVNQIGDLNYVGNGAVTMVQDPNDIRLVSVDGTPTVVDNIAAMRGALDYLDTVTNSQLYTDVSDPNRGRRVWGRGFGHFGAEEARDGNQVYDYNTAGTAIGGDIEIANGLRLGLSAGYANTDANVVGNAAEADIDSEHAALYARYDIGSFFVTAAVTGGLQQFDMKRKVAGLGAVGDTEAKVETDGYVYGGSLQTGIDLDIGSGWRLTPSAAVLYQHQTVDGYQERGADQGNVTMKDQKSEAIRLSGQMNLAKTIDFEGFDLTPHISAGIANEIIKGGKARGTFSDGTEFELELQDDNQVMGLAGAGIRLGFDTGLALSLDYQGRLSGDTTDHGILAGIAFKW